MRGSPIDFDIADAGTAPDASMDAAELASRSNDAAQPRLQPGPFLRQVAEDIKVRSAPTEEPIQVQARGRLIKCWFGPEPSIHYEIAIHERTGKIELGLHCESSPQYNRSLYKAFDRCILDIQQTLGTSFWLEEWDHGWIRLYETHPLYPLDTYRVGEISERLNEIIAALEPIYAQITEEVGPPPPAPARSPGQGSWRSRRR